MSGRILSYELEEPYLNCQNLESISLFNDKILFKKHTHKINHIDLKKNLLMTSGDDDLIIIIDLKIIKYVLVFYDIINGTKYAKFLEPLTTKMIYYGYKSFKLYVYDYVRKEIIIVVNLLRDNLTHFEYNNKSNIIITTQVNNNILWLLQENKLKPEYKIKNSYYAIINNAKQHILSCAKIDKNYGPKNISTVISIYKYDINRNLLVSKECDLNTEINYNINLMNFYKNCDNYYLIIMSDYVIEILNLDNNGNKIFHINLNQEKDIKFSYIEPVFTKEIIVGFNDGDIDLMNPFISDQKKNKNLILNKYKPENEINKLIESIVNNEVRHQTSIVQIKMSDYYPFYVSIADEMIIYQYK
jgi:hypothetical protein